MAAATAAADPTAAATAAEDTEVAVSPLSPARGRGRVRGTLLDT